MLIITNQYHIKYCH